MGIRNLVAVCGLVCIVISGAPLHAEDEGSAPNTSSDAVDSFYTPDFEVKGQVRQLVGPKRVVAVGEFASTGAFETFYGDWDAGGGVEAIMTSGLVQSEQFVVVDRAALSQVLNEKELQAAGLTANGSTAPTGGIIGAQLLVLGAITQVDLDKKGSGFSFGISGGPLGRRGNAGIAPQFRSGKLVMDVRVVDVKTTQVVDSFSVKQKVKDKSVGLTVGYDYASFGTTNFWKTPLGEAMRKLVAKAVMKIVESSDGVPWHAQVVEFEQPVIYINAGSQNGLKAGDALVVTREGRAFTDPSTGEVLSQQVNELGSVLVERVEPRLAEGTFISQSAELPRRGDRVDLIP